MKYSFFLFLLLTCLSLHGCADKEYEIPVKIDTNKEELLPSNPVAPLTANKKWSFSALPSGLSSGSMQGAAIYKGRIYQFRNSNLGGQKVLTYDEYDTQSGVWEKGEKPITCVPESHAGSASFSPVLVASYAVGNDVYYCNLPFVYLSGHYSVEVNGRQMRYEIIDVVDIENDRCVRRYTFPDRTDDVIAAYDFQNSKVWLVGYDTKVSGMSPYVIEEYKVDLLSLVPQKTNFTSQDVVSSFTVGGPNRLGYQESLACGTLQDAVFHNGYIYLAVGRGSEANRTEWARIHAYDIYCHKIVNTIICPDYTEPEGLVRDGDDIYMTTRNLWKLSERNGYDNKYNFEPATEVATDSFTIGNASQLVWFKSQVYCGRTNIKGTLVANIDMAEVDDPFTFYVYDTNIKDGTGVKNRIFESHYAFRGMFDGQYYTIKNLRIERTPFFNDGLFPYVVNATIKNVNVSGRIKLTEAIHSSADDVDVKNVGFIGYMNGGKLENIDVSGIAFDFSGVSSYSNIGKLVGFETGKIEKTNITISKE